MCFEYVRYVVRLSANIISECREKYSRNYLSILLINRTPVIENHEPILGVAVKNLKDVNTANSIMTQGNLHISTCNVFLLVASSLKSGATEPLTVGSVRLLVDR